MVAGIIVISEAVQPNDRPFYNLHEVYCVHMWKDEPGHCLRATNVELEAAREKGEKFIEGYLFRRMEFYDRLITYHAARNAKEEFLDELKASRARLEEEYRKIAR